MSKTPEIGKKYRFELEQTIDGHTNLTKIEATLVDFEEIREDKVLEALDEFKEALGEDRRVYGGVTTMLHEAGFNLVDALEERVKEVEKFFEEREGPKFNIKIDRKELLKQQFDRSCWDNGLIFKEENE